MDHERRLANLDRRFQTIGRQPRRAARREPRIPPAGRRLPASCACRSIPRPRSGAPRRSSPGLREGSPAIYTGVERTHCCSTPLASGKARKRSSRGAPLAAGVRVRPFRWSSRAQRGMTTDRRAAIRGPMTARRWVEVRLLRLERRRHGGAEVLRASAIDLHHHPLDPPRKRTVPDTLRSRAGRCHSRSRGPRRKSQSRPGRWDLALTHMLAVDEQRADATVLAGPSELEAERSRAVGHRHARANPHLPGPGSCERSGAACPAYRRNSRANQLPWAKSTPSAPPSGTSTSAVIVGAVLQVDGRVLELGAPPG